MEEILRTGGRTGAEGHPPERSCLWHEEAEGELVSSCGSSRGNFFTSGSDTGGAPSPSGLFLLFPKRFLAFAPQEDSVALLPALEMTVLKEDVHVNASSWTRRYPFKLGPCFAFQNDANQNDANLWV